MLRTVIFDFDGVITDSEILHLRAFNKVLNGYGIEIATKDYYTTYLGLTDVDCFNLLIQQGKLNSNNVQIEDLVRQKNIVFEELAKSDGKIIEGVRDFLEMLAQNEVPMAICSGAFRYPSRFSRHSISKILPPTIGLSAGTGIALACETEWHKSHILSR